MTCAKCYRELANLALGCIECAKDAARQSMRKAQVEPLLKTHHTNGNIALIVIAPRGQWHVAMFGFAQTFCGSGMRGGARERRVIQISDITQHLVCKDCLAELHELLAEAI